MLRFAVILSEAKDLYEVHSTSFRLCAYNDVRSYHDGSML